MAPLFTLYVTVVLGVAVTVRLDADPAQTGLAPAIEILATGKGFTITSMVSSTTGHATVTMLLLKIIVMVPFV